MLPRRGGLFGRGYHGGRPMEMWENRPGRPMGRTFIRPDPQSGLYKLHVRSIPLHWSELAVTNIFRKAGTPVSVYLSPPPYNFPLKWGFVEFATFEEARTAIDILNNNPVIDNLQVSFAREKVTVDSVDSSGYEQDPVLQYLETVNSDQDLPEDSFLGEVPVDTAMITRVVRNDSAFSINCNMESEYVLFPLNDDKRKCIEEALFQRVMKIYKELPPTGKCEVCQEACSLCCSQCNTYYCSVECQTKHWPAHSKACLPEEAQNGNASGNQGSGDVAAARGRMSNGSKLSESEPANNSRANAFNGNKLDDKPRYNDRSNKFGDKWNNRPDDGSAQKVDQRGGRFNQDRNRNRGDVGNQQNGVGRMTNLAEERMSKFKQNKPDSFSNTSPGQGQINTSSDRQHQFMGSNSVGNRPGQPRATNDRSHFQEAKSKTESSSPGIEFIANEREFLNKPSTPLASRPAEQSSPFVVAHASTPVSATKLITPSPVQPSPPTAVSASRPALPPVDTASDKLVQGKVEEVMVVTVEPPGMFNVHLRKEVLDACNIGTALDSADESYPPITPTENCLCIAKFEESWYRCKVISMNPLKVYYMDFGNTEVKTPDQLFALPQKYHSIPPYAIKVKLADNTPEELMKTDGEYITIKPILKEHDYWVVQVEGVEYPAPQVPVVPTPEVPVVPAPEFPVAPASERVQVIQEAQTNPLLPPDVFTKTIVMFREEGGRLKVTPKEKVQELHDFMRKLQTEAPNAAAVTPTPRTRCIVKCTETNQWYRGYIKSSEPLYVYFADYGHTVHCTLDNLRSLPPAEFTNTLPFVTTVQTREPNTFSVNDVIHVKPLCKDTTTKTWIVEAIAATSVQPSPSGPSSTPLQTPPSTQLCVQNVSVVPVELPSPAVQPSTPIPAASSTQPDLPNTSIRSTEASSFPHFLPADKFTTVIIMCMDEVAGQGDTYFVGNKAGCAMLFDMNKHFASCISSYGAVTPEVGALALAPYDGEWYRVKLVSTSPLKVHYIDYGNTEPATPESLKRCPDTHKDVPNLVSRIKLAAGTDMKYYKLEATSELSVKPVSSLPDGTVIVHVEGETYTVGETSATVATTVPHPSPSLQPSDTVATTVPHPSPSLQPLDTVATTVPHPSPSLQPSDTVATTVPHPSPSSQPSDTVATTVPHPSPSLQPSDTVATTVPHPSPFLQTSDTVATTVSNPSPSLQPSIPIGTTPSPIVSQYLPSTSQVTPVVEVSYAPKTVSSPSSSTQVKERRQYAVNLLQEGWKFTFVPQKVDIIRPRIIVGQIYNENIPETQQLLLTDEFDDAIKSQPDDPTFRPNDGDLVACHVSINDWERGEITSDGQLVSLVDVGKVIRCNKFKKLPQQFANVPFMASAISFARLSTQEVKRIYAETEITCVTRKVEVDSFGRRVISICGKIEALEFEGEMLPWLYDPLATPDPLCNGDLVNIINVFFSNSFVVVPANDNAIHEKVQIECKNNIMVVPANDNEINQKIQIECRNNTVKFKTPPQKSEYVTVLSQNDTYLRSRVVNIKEDKTTYEVYNIDLGTFTSEKLSNIHPMPSSLLKIPCRATAVELKDIDRKDLTEECQMYIKNLMREEVILKIHFHEDDKVILTVNDSGETVNDIVRFWQQPNISLDGKYWWKDLPKPNPPMNKEVNLVVALNDPLYFQQYEEMLNYYKEIHPIIQDHCNADNAPYNPSARELCFAKFDEFWYRAYCCKETNQGVSTVMLVDYGNITVVETKYIRRITPDMLQFKILGIKCKISGLPNELSPEQKFQIDNLLGIDNQHLAVFVSKVDEDDIYEVKIPAVLSALNIQ